MDTLYAWAAGFIDGEGTISIKRYQRKTKSGKYYYYQPFVSLSQSVIGGHEKGVIKMKELFGGSIGTWQDKRSSVRYPTMQWSVVSFDAEKCINLIYPYLIVKKSNADVLLKFYRKRTKYSGGSGKIKLTQEEIKIREDLFIESHLLNQKGKLRLQRLSELTAKADAIV